jgi:hypothetical protein
MDRCPSCQYPVQVEWDTCRRCGTPLPLALREAAESRVHVQLPSRRAVRPVAAVPTKSVNTVRSITTAPGAAARSIALSGPCEDTLLPDGPHSVGRTGGADNLLPHGRVNRRRRWHW